MTTTPSPAAPPTPRRSSPPPLGSCGRRIPTLAPEDVAEILRASAKPSADLANKVRAGGRLDVVEALAAPWTVLEGSALRHRRRADADEPRR
jgi:hypothetical protein